MTHASKRSVVSNYLFFNGNAEEAMDFYAKKLGATVGMKLRFSESPEPVPAGMIPEGFENKIMHSEFTIGETRILASDGCGNATTHSGFALALVMADEQKAHEAFNGLAEEGEVQMPLSKTFWSPCYGQVKDKFGILWMVMVPAAM